MDKVWFFGRNFLLWLAVGFVSILVIKGTAIGEVVLTISASRGWGIHSFDLILIPIYLLAFISTVLDYVIYVRNDNDKLDEMIVE